LRKLQQDALAGDESTSPEKGTGGSHDMTIHPRLSLNAMCTYKWSFDQDFALWRDLGLRHAGLLEYKLADDLVGKLTKLNDAGINAATVITNSFDLREPTSWEKTRAAHRALIDCVAAAGGHSIYFTPGRTTGAPWRDVLRTFAEAVAPTVAYGKARGVLACIEPSLRSDVSFVNTLRDAIHVAELTGVSLVADFGNMWMERDFREILRAAMPYIALIQISDVIIGTSGKPSPGGRAHVGEGELPLHRMMQDALDAGYTDVFDLEVVGPKFDADCDEATVRRGVASASALLRDMGI
jgi:sugar phosphate isomerase/epimerase